MLSASTQTPKAQLATFPDLLLIPEEHRRHEILDGEVVEKALPRGDHGNTQITLAMRLREYQRRQGEAQKPGGWWFSTETTIELTPHTVVQPDVVGWRRERMPKRPSGYPMKMRPDWVCEIMCDGDARRRDALLKRRLYADHGVAFYWLVDAEREDLTVLSLTERGYVEQLTASRADRVHAAPFDLIELQVGALFGDDEE